MVSLAPVCPHSGTWADGAHLHQLAYHVLLCQGDVNIETYALSLKGFHPDMKHVASIGVSLDRT